MKGNGYIYLGICFTLEGFFPIFTFFALQSLEVLWVIVFSLIVSISAGTIIFIKEKMYIGYKNKEILFPTIMSSLFLGIGGIMYFFGIKYSSPSIASLLLLTQTLFAFIIFNLLGKEDYHLKQIIGAILMLIGGTIILYEGESFINLGAIIMIIACIIFTIGNFYTKKASLLGAKPLFLLVNRNYFMLIITSVLAFTILGIPDILQVKENLIWLFLIGFFVLFIGKSLWIIALSKLNSFVAISFFPIVPLLVLIFSFIFLDEIPSMFKLLGFLPIMLGSILLIKKY